MTYSIKIEGLEELKDKLGSHKLIMGPLKTFLNKAGHTVEGRVKNYTPVDTGRLRASITTQVEPLRATVGTNVKYSSFVEFGTRPHFPPLSAMQPWARRHGFPTGKAGAFLVALAIARHGTRPRYMFKYALEDFDVKNKIDQYLQEMYGEIKKFWES